MTKSLRKLVSVTIICLLALSCSKAPQKITSVAFQDAKEKFLETCREEMKVEPVIMLLEKTLWIYLPINEDIVEMKASGYGMSASRESKVSPTLNFLEVQYAQRHFHVSYDINLSESYGKDYGYSSNYSEQFQNMQQGLLSVVNRAFFEVKDQPIELVVFTITDIDNGIESENILSFADLKKALSVAQELPQDEFLKRYVSSLRGDKRAIGSTQGVHLTPRPIPFGEFLAMQMENRINFKYQRSNFPPGDEAQTEIIAQIQDTLQAYAFKDYDEIILTDLRTGTQKRLK